MGVVALALPIALWPAGGYAGHYSISYFYYVNDLSRNILVGCLWATGVFLFLYHGLSELENWILNAAGLFGVSVAMNPMGAIQCGDHAGGFFSIHAVSASAFFLCLAVVAIWLSKGRVKYIHNARMRINFKIAYNITGCMMISMPAVVVVIHSLRKSGCTTHWIFWVECFGIWAFSAFWFVKTIEYRLLLGNRNLVADLL